MAIMSLDCATELPAQPDILQELGFTLAEIEALLDGVLTREGWAHVKERVRRPGLSYQVRSPTESSEVLLCFQPLPDRSFAGGRIRFPCTRLTGKFRNASPHFIDGWLRRLQHIFLKGGG